MEANHGRKDNSAMTISNTENPNLQALVKRIEALEDEKAARAADIKEVYAEAKAFGFDTKIIRKVVAIRKKKAAEHNEEQELIETYMAALGMLADTPLGRAAIERDGVQA